jgi:predicted PurR-regulated permease PerM
VGLLSFLLSFIPAVGYWLALIPPTLLAFLQFGVPEAAAVFIGYAIINTFADNLLRPKMMGSGLDLAPSVVFLAVIFWGLVLGPVGAILAVPITMGIKQLVLEPDERNRRMADLMSSGHSPKAEDEEEEEAAAS